MASMYIDPTCVIMSKSLYRMFAHKFIEGIISVEFKIVFEISILSLPHIKVRILQSAYVLDMLYPLVLKGMAEVKNSCNS